MGIPETDLIEEMDLSSVECLNMVRPPSRPDRSPSPPPALPLERSPRRTFASRRAFQD